MVFGRKEAGPKRGILEIMGNNLTGVLMLVIITLILFQALGLLLQGPFGITIPLGPVFILLPLAVASIMGVAIVRKMLTNEPIQKTDIFAIVIVIALALLVLFTLEDTVPAIFSQSMIQLQSMVGLG